jgi:23S rRNA pseudouridine2605 synthase
MADRITVDGVPIPAHPELRYFALNKPPGVTTTLRDPHALRSLRSFLPEGPRVFPVGRLDRESEGLLLLTNDGGLACALELPANAWLRRYRVRAHGRVNPERLAALRSGIAIDGVRYGPIEASVDREQGANIWLTFAIREGKNREVRNVLEHLGLKVNRLIRVSFGPFQLGDIPEGAVEEIRTRLSVPRDQVVYVGDGQSDIPVMLHVNRGDGFTIAASEAVEVAHIAKRTIISDDALSVLVPVLEEIAGFGPSEIRALFEDQGLVIQEWDRVRTDWLTIRDGAADGVVRLDLTGT